MNADMLRALGMSTAPCAATVLLIVRADALAAPAGVLFVSPYADGASRRSGCAVLPQSGCARLFPVPSMVRKSADISWRTSSDSKRIRLKEESDMACSSEQRRGAPVARRVARLAQEAVGAQ